MILLSLLRIRIIRWFLMPCDTCKILLWSLVDCTLVCHCSWITLWSHCNYSWCWFISLCPTLLELLSGWVSFAKQVVCLDNVDIFVHRFRHSLSFANFQYLSFILDSSFRCVLVHLLTKTYPCWSCRYDSKRRLTNGGSWCSITEMTWSVIQAMIHWITHSIGWILTTLIFNTWGTVIKTLPIGLINVRVIEPTLDLAPMVSFRIVLVLWIIFLLLVPKY